MAEKISWSHSRKKEDRDEEQKPNHIFCIDCTLFVIGRAEGNGGSPGNVRIPIEYYSEGNVHHLCDHRHSSNEEQICAELSSSNDPFRTG